MVIHRLSPESSPYIPARLPKFTPTPYAALMAPTAMHNELAVILSRLNRLGADIKINIGSVSDQDLQAMTKDMNKLLERAMAISEDIAEESMARLRRPVT